MESIVAVGRVLVQNKLPFFYSDDPYEAVYGQPPPQHLPCLPGKSKVEVVAKCLRDREDMLLMLKFHLMRAQHRMHQFADQHRTDRHFDWVYVKLQTYRQQSVVTLTNQNLSPKYFGPYKIIDKCWEVAYKLELPVHSKVHPVFHVSQLKVMIGSVLTSTELPIVGCDVLVREPECVLERKMLKRQGRAATMLLIKWKNCPADEALWEFMFDLAKKFPSFQP